MYLRLPVRAYPCVAVSVFESTLYQSLRDYDMYVLCCACPSTPCLHVWTVPNQVQHHRAYSVVGGHRVAHGVA